MEWEGGRGRERGETGGMEEERRGREVEENALGSEWDEKEQEGAREEERICDRMVGEKCGLRVGEWME